KRGTARAVLEIRREVTNRGESEASDRRARGSIDQLVQASLRTIRPADDAAVTCELPAVSREQTWRSGDRVAECDGRVSLGRIGSAIGEPAAGWSRSGAGLDVGQADESADRRRRHVQRKTIALLDIELPSEERDGEALLEEKAVAQTPFLGREVAL